MTATVGWRDPRPAQLLPGVGAEGHVVDLVARVAADGDSDRSAAAAGSLIHAAVAIGAAGVPVAVDRVVARGGVGVSVPGCGSGIADIQGDIDFDMG